MQKTISSSAALLFSSLQAPVLLRYFLQMNREYEALFQTLEQSNRVFSQQPDPLRNALGFYLGHTAAFGRRRLVSQGLLPNPHPFDELLERGVSPDSAAEIEHNQHWPELQAIWAYRQQVRREVEMLLADAGPWDFDLHHPFYSLLMTVEHECLHFHTTIPLLSKLPLRYFSHLPDTRPLQTGQRLSACAQRLSIAGKTITYGRPEGLLAQQSFGWDNEFGLKQAEVADFSCSRFPLSNWDVLCFIQAGGYHRPEFWSDGPDSLAFMQACQRPHPFNFVPSATAPEGYAYRALFAEYDFVPYDLPAQLNWYEASAICRFLGGEMISEPQYMLASSSFQAEPVAVGGCAPLPVSTPPAFASGNIGIWTSADFAPLETPFEVHEAYPDFSEPWFNSGHAVIRGASWAARGQMRQPCFRDFMQKQLDYLASTYVVF